MSKGQEEFEAWFRAQAEKESGTILPDELEIDFKASHVALMWQAWQAARKQAPAEHAEPIYQISDGVNGWEDVDRVRHAACSFDPENYYTRVVYAAPADQSERIAELEGVLLEAKRTFEHYFPGDNPPAHKRLIARIDAALAKHGDSHE